MPKYFDVHSHLNASQYDADREEVIQRMRESETHTIVIGTDLESSQKAVELAEKHEEIYASIGIHPADDPSASWEVYKFNKLISSKKVVAIGECGFDFYHAKKEEDYERQKKLFVDQIEFAIKYDKPLMIHARPARLPSGGNAYEELLETLIEFKGIRGNIHFFAGSWDIAQKFFELGFTISFTGVITFTHDYDEVIRNAPIDKILSETDAPLVAPVPYRGKRNEPSYVSEVVKRIAEIKGEDFEVVRVALAQNGLRMIM